MTTPIGFKGGQNAIIGAFGLTFALGFMTGCVVYNHPHGGAPPARSPSAAGPVADAAALDPKAPVETYGPEQEIKPIAAWPRPCDPDQAREAASLQDPDHPLVSGTARNSVANTLNLGVDARQWRALDQVSRDTQAFLYDCAFSGPGHFDRIDVYSPAGDRLASYSLAELEHFRR